MNNVPNDLLEDLKGVLPPDSKVEFYEHPYEDEDYTIEIKIKKKYNKHEVLSKALDVKIDYDEKHDVNTLVLVDFFDSETRQD